MFKVLFGWREGKAVAYRSDQPEVLETGHSEDEAIGKFFRLRLRDRLMPPIEKETDSGHSAEPQPA